jgi:hypothetical protein
MSLHHKTATVQYFVAMAVLGSSGGDRAGRGGRWPRMALRPPTVRGQRDVAGPPRRARHPATPGVPLATAGRAGVAWKKTRIAN